MPLESYQKPVPHQYCPVCRNGIDRSTDLAEEGGALEPGDYAICEHCGSFLVLTNARLVQHVTDDAVRTDPRFSPRSIAQLFEVQRAVRARARLLVSRDSNGERTVTMVDQIEGRHVYHEKN